jgi:hypothetical protein
LRVESGAPPLTQKQAADTLHVSERSVNAAKKVQKKGTPRLNKAVEKGAMSVDKAAKATRLPAEEQDKQAQAALDGKAGRKPRPRPKKAPARKTAPGVNGNGAAPDELRNTVIGTLADLEACVRTLDGLAVKGVTALLGLKQFKKELKSLAEVKQKFCNLIDSWERELENLAAMK